MFLLNHVLTRGRHILHRTWRKQHRGLCKKEQLQLLRKQSMPMCHNSTSTSTFFKNINLKLKWKTSYFRSVPKTLERQLLNQNIALPFFFHFFTPLLLWASLNVNSDGLHLSFNLWSLFMLINITEIEDSHQSSILFFTEQRECKCKKIPLVDLNPLLVDERWVQVYYKW